jgi:hypothetical protein
MPLFSMTIAPAFAVVIISASVIKRPAAAQ